MIYYNQPTLISRNDLEVYWYVRQTYSNYGDRCFMVASPKLLNSLPAGLRQMDICYEQFKWLACLGVEIGSVINARPLQQHRDVRVPIFNIQSVRTCDREVAGSSPGRRTTGQVANTHVPLSPRSIIWYRPKCGDALRPGR